jgi:peptidoglycan/LPS O-acetylase OafA/YrhL
MLMPMFAPGEAKFIRSGWLWVDFFFILSGFIITYVYGNIFKESIKAGYWKYIGARFARIYPLHLFTLVWSLACTLLILYYANTLHPFFATIYDPAAVPACLLLIQSLHLYIATPLNAPSWSLSTEWWTYMIFPFLVPYFSRIKISGKILTFLFIIGVYVVIKYLLGPIAQPFPGGPPTLNVIVDFGIFRCLAGFLSGMLLFEIYRERTGYAILKRSWCFVIMFVGILLVMHFGLDDLLLVLLFFPLTILTAAYNDTRVKRILDTPFLQRLGDWSFSIYMVHIQ